MVSANLPTKAVRILACPRCKKAAIVGDPGTWHCGSCGCEFGSLHDVPVLIPPESPVTTWFDVNEPRAMHGPRGLTRWMRSMQFADRVWTRRAQRALERALRDATPDAPESVALLVGSGFEPVFRQICQKYKDILRVGLADRGTNVVCDLCHLPALDQSVDLIFSSSVLEHVYDPEKAITEMHRVLKVGGQVYAEIPFMRGYHMIPIDYQRYTIAGIEEVFARNGFEMIEKGICSGPFTAAVLQLKDLASQLLRFNRYARRFALLLLNLLHPVKYLDRLFEESAWATVNACNFYYLGRKGKNGK